MKKKLVLFLSFLFILSSCANKKKVLYLYNNNGTSPESSLRYENTLQPDDNLQITVTAAQPELASDFNLMYLSARSTESTSAVNNTLYTYLIDQQGNIDFPVLGKIKLSGLTRIQAEDKIKELLKSYIAEPGVNLRVTNFEVSVMGEVARPGVQNVIGDRITILEALSYSGDLTIYGQRENVSVIREKDGVKTITEVNLTDANLINSPVYYLAHNDVVYVKPNKTRINSSVVGPNLTVGLSAISLLVTIIALSTR
jgi:polysaccharide export outer membrane protein